MSDLKKQPILTAFNVPLSMVAASLIQEGMFRCVDGEYSGLLSKYKSALSGKDCNATYVMYPKIGIAIHTEGNFNIYVHNEHRMKGFATKLVEDFYLRFPEVIDGEIFVVQEPTGSIVNKVVKKHSKSQSSDMMDLKAKKNELLKLLKKKNIKMDRFSYQYLEDSTGESVDYLFNFIQSGDYTSSAYIEGDVKDILVGNVGQLTTKIS